MLVVRSMRGAERKSVGDLVHRLDSVLQHQPADGRPHGRFAGWSRARRGRVHGEWRDHRRALRRDGRHRRRPPRDAPARGRVPRRAERQRQETHHLGIVQQAAPRRDGVGRRSAERRGERRRCDRRGAGENRDSQEAATTVSAAPLLLPHHPRQRGHRRCGRGRSAVVAFAAGSSGGHRQAGNARGAAPGRGTCPAGRPGRDARRDRLRHGSAILRTSQGTAASCASSLSTTATNPIAPSR